MRTGFISHIAGMAPAVLQMQIKLQGTDLMYVVSYDLSNNKLRNKVAKELENYGRRVQYSVFECRISKKQMEQLYKKLLPIMQREPEGNIRIYRICMNCEEQIQTIGIKNECMTAAEEDIFVI